MSFNYFISLGCSCFPALVGDTGEFRTCALPFDWNAGGIDVIEDCLDSNFSNFLDKSQYIKELSGVNPTQTVCGHKKYGYNYFIHKYPLADEDYTYFVRTVERFRTLLRDTNSKKLFLMFTFPTIPKTGPITIADRRTEFNRERINRVVKRISEKSGNSSYFIVWNINLNKPNKLTVTTEGSLTIVDVDTPYHDIGYYNANPVEIAKAVDTINKLYKFVPGRQL
jgi:hypothetical protein